jgi:glyoxylase-like metal-dependent hydrolase (beta-lactamase superfamily II)
LLPIRIRLGANNLYLLAGPAGAVCVDAGPDYPGAWEQLTGQLAAHGLDVADVRAVVLTHHHRDHAGLAARWQATGARVYAGRGDEEMLRLDEAGRARLRGRAAAVLSEHGVPAASASQPPAPRAGMGAEHGADDWPGPLRMTPLRPDRLLDDGNLVEDAGLPLRVLALPGHTPGTLVVRDERTGAVYTGDHLLPRAVATVGIQFAGEQRWPAMPAFVRSLARTARLCAGARGWPGHGDPIADAGAAAAWSLRHVERRAERLHRRLAEGPATAYALARRVLPHLQPAHVWTVMAETLGLLDLLAERGLATWERRDGKIVFRATADEG